MGYLFPLDWHNLDFDGTDTQVGRACKVVCTMGLRYDCSVPWRNIHTKIGLHEKERPLLSVAYTDSRATCFSIAGQKVSWQSHTTIELDVCGAVNVSAIIFPMDYESLWIVLQSVSVVQDAGPPDAPCPGHMVSSN